MFQPEPGARQTPSPAELPCPQAVTSESSINPLSPSMHLPLPRSPSPGPESCASGTHTSQAVTPRSLRPHGHLYHHLLSHRRLLLQVSASERTCLCWSPGSSPPPPPAPPEMPGHPCRLALNWGPFPRCHASHQRVYCNSFNERLPYV